MKTVKEIIKNLVCMDCLDKLLPCTECYDDIDRATKEILALVPEKKEEDAEKIVKQNPKATKFEWLRNCIENEIIDEILERFGGGDEKKL